MMRMMKKTKDSFELSASDLVGYLNCRHLAALDRAVAEGALQKPKSLTRNSIKLFRFLRGAVL